MAEVTIELAGQRSTTTHHPGTTILQTARQMGISHGNAKILQYRALRKAAALGDFDG